MTLELLRILIDHVQLNLQTWIGIEYTTQNRCSDATKYVTVQTNFHIIVTKSPIHYSKYRLVITHFQNVLYDFLHSSTNIVKHEVISKSVKAIE